MATLFAVKHEKQINNGFTIKNESTNENPEYATNGSSGFDLRTNVLESVTILPMKIEIIPTGLFFNIPDNHEIQIRPRSGLAAKYVLRY
jgi:dUTP pyrophosphatase